MATIPELFDSLKAYINSVIGDKITIINGKTVEASNSADAAADSASNAANSAQDSADSAASSADAAASAVEQRITQLVGQAPETLDTLEEFAAALGDDPNFSTTMFQKLGEKADTEVVNSALAGKSNNGHKHVTADVTDARTYGGGTQDANAVLKTDSGGWIYFRGQPTHGHHPAPKGYVDTQIATRAASSHNHTFAQVPGLQSALDGKQPKSWVGTQAQYDALATKDPNVTYNIVEGT